jgi:DNA-binding transcriptional ArsR family regulator
MTPQREIADLLEQLDIPRVPAQITALLLVHDPPARSFGELQAALGVSKGAISMAVHYLEALELVHASSLSGSRKRLVQLEPRHFVHYLRRRMTYFRAFATALQAVAATHDDTAHARELAWLAELCRSLDGAVMTILTTWEENTDEKLRRDPQTPALSHPLQE